MQLKKLSLEPLEDRRMMTVTYHGGALLPHVETQAVFLGEDWRSNASLRAETRQLDHFLDTLVTGGYTDMLRRAGYHVGRGSNDNGRIADLSLDKSQPLTDQRIHRERKQFGIGYSPAPG